MGTTKLSAAAGWGLRVLIIRGKGTGTSTAAAAGVDVEKSSADVEVPGTGMFKSSEEFRTTADVGELSPTFSVGRRDEWSDGRGTDEGTSVVC